MDKDKSILVIEDDIVTRGMIKKILGVHGYEVSTAVDGMDAVLCLTKRNFDLILCDIYMPNLNGFQLLEFLNRNGLKIPVIFLTVSNKIEDEIKGLRLGAEDYIRKPINRSTLLLRVGKVLSHSMGRVDQISSDQLALKPNEEKETKNIFLSCEHDKLDEEILIQ